MWTKNRKRGIDMGRTAAGRPVRSIRKNNVLPGSGHGPTDLHFGKNDLVLIVARQLGKAPNRLYIYGDSDPSPARPGRQAVTKMCKTICTICTFNLCNHDFNMQNTHSPLQGFADGGLSLAVARGTELQSVTLAITRKCPSRGRGTICSFPSHCGCLSQNIARHCTLTINLYGYNLAV
jgi:hypothetical protein